MAGVRIGTAAANTSRRCCRLGCRCRCGRGSRSCCRGRQPRGRARGRPGGSADDIDLVWRCWRRHLAVWGRRGYVGAERRGEIRAGVRVLGLPVTLMVQLMLTGHGSVTGRAASVPRPAVDPDEVAGLDVRQRGQHGRVLLLALSEHLVERVLDALDVVVVGGVGEGGRVGVGEHARPEVHPASGAAPGVDGRVLLGHQGGDLGGVRYARNILQPRMLELAKLRLVSSLEDEGPVAGVPEAELVYEEREQEVERTDHLLDAEVLPPSKVLDQPVEPLLGVGVGRQEVGLANVELRHGPAAEAARPREQPLAVVEDEVLRPDVLELLPEAVVHRLLGGRVQQVADTSLEVVDGLLAVALRPEVAVDVAETVGPALELNEVGGLIIKQ